MSSVMYLDKISQTGYEKSVVTLIKKGIEDFPQSFTNRNTYYKDLFDKVVKKDEVSVEFRKNFSLFVSSFSDVTVYLKESVKYLDLREGRVLQL